MKVDTKDLYTISNAAERLKSREGFGVKTQRVYQLISLEKLTAISIDGIKFIHKDEIARFNKNYPV